MASDRTPLIVDGEDRGGPSGMGTFEQPLGSMVGSVTRSNRREAPPSDEESRSSQVHINVPVVDASAAAIARNLTGAVDETKAVAVGDGAIMLSAKWVTSYARSRVPSFYILNFLREYSRDTLLGDCSAALVITIMMIPQSLAYATLAGLSPVAGIYASFFSLVSYPWFATSPHLSVGPVALAALLNAAAVGSFADAGSDHYVELTLYLAFVTGAVLCLMHFFKAGYLVNFLSHPVLKGFSFASAVTIATSQLGSMFGFKVVDSTAFVAVISDVVMKLGGTNVPTLVLGLANLLLLAVAHWLKKKYASLALFPTPVLLVILNILVVSYAQLDTMGVHVVGYIPPGFPTPRFFFSGVSQNEAVSLLSQGFVIAIIGVMESVSVAKMMALKYDYDIDSSQEMFALGIANVFCSFFGAFPVSGSFSRTPVMASAGGKTTVASLVSAVLVIVVLVAATSVLHYVPLCFLGAMIIFAVQTLVDLEVPQYLWKVDRADLFVYVAAALFTLFLSIEDGLLISCGLSLARVIYSTTSAHVATIGRVGDTHTFRNLARFPGIAHPVQGFVLLRFDASLCFANCLLFNDIVLSACMPQIGSPPNAIVVDCSGITSADSSSALMLCDIQQNINKRVAQLRAKRILALVKELAKAPERGKREVQSELDKARSEPDKPPRLYMAAVRGHVRDIISGAREFHHKKQKGKFDPAEESFVELVYLMDVDDALLAVADHLGVPLDESADTGRPRRMTVLTNAADIQGSPVRGRGRGYSLGVVLAGDTVALDLEAEPPQRRSRRRSTVVRAGPVAV